MGGGIAQVVAASGRRVSLHDAQSGATDRALDTMRKSLAKLEEKGGPAAQEVFARVEDVKAIFAKLREPTVEGLLLWSSPIFDGRAQEIGRLTAEHRLIAMLP